MIDYWQILLLMSVGCVAGLLNVMAGGGSMLTVPVMVFLDIPGPVANGTNRIAILAQCLTAVITFFKKGYADFRLSLTLSLCALPGAIIGAWMGTRLEGVWFNRVLALIMIGIMLLMSVEKKYSAPMPVHKPANLVLGHLLMVGVGCFGGFLQIGVGFLFLPVLHRVLGLDLVTANMHKVFIIGTYTIAALFIFAVQVQVLWLLGICLAIGTSIGGWFGAHISITRGERYIRLILNVVLAVFIIKLLFF